MLYTFFWLNCVQVFLYAIKYFSYIRHDSKDYIYVTKLNQYFKKNISDRSSLYIDIFGKIPNTAKFILKMELFQKYIKHRFSFTMKVITWSKNIANQIKTLVQYLEKKTHLFILK